MKTGLVLFPDYLASGDKYTIRPVLFVLWSPNHADLSEWSEMVCEISRLQHDSTISGRKSFKLGISQPNISIIFRLGIHKYQTSDLSTEMVS